MRAIAASTSLMSMLRPPRMMVCFWRPMTRIEPSSATSTRSPVGRNPSAVSSGGHRDAASRIADEQGRALDLGIADRDRQPMGSRLRRPPGRPFPGTDARPGRGGWRAVRRAAAWCARDTRTCRTPAGRWYRASARRVRRALSSIGPPPTVIARSDDNAPAASARPTAAGPWSGRASSTRPGASPYAANAAAGDHLPIADHRPPRSAGKYMPKQNAATDDSGTKAPTGLVGFESDGVDRAPAGIADGILGLHHALGMSGGPGRHRDGAPPLQRSTSLNEPERERNTWPAERGRRDRETVLGYAPAGEGMWFGDHQVGIDVVDSQAELGLGGVWAEHRDDAAPKADRNGRGDGVPRVVGLHERGRRGRMDGAIRSANAQAASTTSPRCADRIRPRPQSDPACAGPARPFPVQVLSSP